MSNDKAIREIYEYITANFETVKVKAGKCRFNYKCQMNAVHEASKQGHDKIAMCVYMDNGQPIIHFVNFDGKKFIDNTLGEWAKQYNYYFIKFIDKEDMWDVDVIFSNFRTHLGKQLNYLTKIFSNYRG